MVRAVTWGGGEQYVLDLSRKCREVGDNVVIVSRGSTAVDDRFRREGLEPVTMRMGGMLDFKSPRALSRLILDMPEDDVVVHVHTFKDAELAARAKSLVGGRKRVNLVCTRHLVKKGKRGWRWKKIYNGIDHLIFVSNLSKEEFLSGRPSIDSGKLIVVHNSVLPPEIGKREEPEARSKDRFQLLYTGRISREKGIDVLIKGLGFLKGEPVELRIAGAGPESLRKELMELAQNEGVSDRIKWLGFVADVYDEIRNADVCVVPSVWREPFGLTILEGMSQGKCVVTSNNGAQKEIITDGRDGVLVDPSDAEGLAEAILRLYRNPELREKIGERALVTFRNKFSYPIFLNKIREIYKD